MPVRIEITGDNAPHALIELRQMAAEFSQALAVPTTPGPVITAQSTDPEVAIGEKIDAALKETRTLVEPSPPPAPKKRGPKPKAPAEPEPAIRATPEDRQPEPGPEEQAAPLTHDDVRNAMHQYVRKYGMKAAQSDIPKLHGYPNVSAIPDEQDKLQEAVQAVLNAIADNPMQREVLQ